MTKTIFRQIIKLGKTQKKKIQIQKLACNKKTQINIKNISNEIGWNQLELFLCEE